MCVSPAGIFAKRKKKEEESLKSAMNLTLYDDEMNHFIPGVQQAYMMMNLTMSEIPLKKKEMATTLHLLFFLG